ncbi:MAG: Zn-dependent alcohol dehydrogenase [Chloroflexi bacterium]|nr:Zn-dependent alcohol dehydrogenase [Chloroflexota bacterium]
MKIKAAVFNEVGEPFQIETLDLEAPHAGEVLVKVEAAGVCRSDYQLITGAIHHHKPVVPGHEGAGTVVEIGEGVTRLKKGDFVALNWAPNCGTCFYCLDGHPSLCSTFTPSIWSGNMLDGTTRFSKNGEQVFHFSAISCFAEYVVVAQEACIPLSKKVPAPVAALIGCAVTTGVGAVINTAGVKPGANVVVFGAGGVGLSSIMGANLAGANRIIAVDVNDTKMEIAKTFGATDTLLTSPDVHKAIREITDGRGADYVFEAIGIPAVQEQALKAVRPGGTLVLEGLSPMDSATNLPGAIITRRELTIKGSYYGSANTAHDFPLFADLYLNNKLDLDRLITKTYPLEDINKAYDELIEGKIARSIIVF